MKKIIIEYLKKKYNAKAILLHGSRARGNPHNQSDWDLLVFTDKIIKGSGGIKLNKEDLDIKVIKIPILDINTFISSYLLYLQCTEILQDTKDGVLNEILGVAKEKISKGPGTTKEEKDAINNHFDRMLVRLEDFRDNPPIFFYHLSSFYKKTIKYWFKYQNRWSQPIVKAIKIFEKEDKDFLDGIKTIINEDKTINERINAAKKMVNTILKKG